MREVKGFSKHDAWLSWLKKETNGFDVAVEFGAGFFDKLNIVNCSLKIGIELYEPYIEHSKCKGCMKIHGDMRDYHTLLPDVKGRKIAIFIDSLEHLDRNDAEKLIGEVKEDFDKIVLMVPENIKQYTDITGFNNHEGQTHRSCWFEKDLLKLGFDGLVDTEFHKDKKDKRCYFVTWNKYENINNRK